MSNQLYDRARHDFATAGLDWTGVTPTAALIDTGVYTFTSTHEYWSSASAGLVGSTVALVSPAVTAAGACDASDTTFTSVSGATIEAIIIFDDTSVAGTSRLIAYIDTATGLPITPNGGSIIVIWDSGTNRIFRV